MGCVSRLSAVLLALALISVCHGSVTFQEYWNLMLPDTPMPAAVRNHLGEPIAMSTIAKSHKHGTGTDNPTNGVDSKLAAGVLSGTDGKPVAIDFATKPILSYKAGDGVDHYKQNGDVVSGVDGKPVTIDFATKPLLHYTNYKAGDGVDHYKQNGDVVSGVDGKPVTIDFATKPILLYNTGDGVDHYKQNGDVVSGVDGKPVTIDFATEPILLYNSKAGDGVDHYKPNGVVVSGVDRKSISSRKASIGSRPNLDGEPATGHKSIAQDNIDNPKAPGFFLEKDLHVGANMKASVDRGFSGDTFLHREVADAIPFSSDKFQEILRRFAVQPGTRTAEILEATLHRCEEPSLASEKKFCATSLESMVDLITSIMGTNDLGTIETVVGGDAPMQLYTVQSWAVVPTPNWTATICHVHKYPYTVFHCHWIPQAKPYVLKMVGEDGSAVDVAAVCHVDTSEWAPTFYALRVFGIRPGEATVCHLLPEGDVVWFPRGSRAAA